MLLTVVGWTGAVDAVDAAPVHAELVSTEPSDGETLASPPEQVVLHFSEQVEAPGDAIVVYDSEGEQPEIDSAQVSGRDVSAPLPSLEDGTYVVSWQVVSADSHPISGSFLFGVGDAAAVDDTADARALMADVQAGEGASRSVGVAYGVARFAVFAGMVLLVGGALFVAWLWPDGVSSPRARRMVGLGWVTVLAGTIAAFGLQAAYASGGSWGDVVDPERLGDVLDTRAGRVWAVRVGLLLVVAVVWRGLLPPWWRRATAPRSQGPHPATVGVLGLALLATVSLAGHAGSGRWVAAAVVADVAHLAGVAFWLAGLGLLALVVLRGGTGESGTAPGVIGRWLTRDRPGAKHLRAVHQLAKHLAGPSQASRMAVGGAPGPTGAGTVPESGGSTAVISEADVDAVGLDPAMVGAGEAGDPGPGGDGREPDGNGLAANRTGRGTTTEQLVKRFSPLAFAAVVVIVLTGTFQSWRQLETWGAVTDTTFGRLLLTKLALVAVVLGAAAVSRATVRRWEGGTSPAALSRSVGSEALVAVVVLAVTAILVNTVPGREAEAAGPAEPAGPFETEVHGSAAAVEVSLEPAQVGPVDVRVVPLTHGGEPLEVQEISATLSLPERSIDDLPVRLEPAGQGAYEASGTDIPFPGTWQLEVVLTISDFESDRLSVDVPIG